MINIPDPFKTTSGWLNEEEGGIFWPQVLYPDIFNYLQFYPTELGNTDLSDYKQCKAYSYYSCGWLQPLYYHEIVVGSKFCILKGECRKLEKINDTFHKLWVIIERQSAKIRAAHCTCMAGMGQTCNHVAAALYRIEAVVRLGFTNLSCTSQLSKWLPNRKEIVPCKIKDIDFSRDKFAQHER